MTRPVLLSWQAGLARVRHNQKPQNENTNPNKNPNMKKKTILTILLLLFSAITLSSCDATATAAEVIEVPPAPDPIEVLKGQVESERELRLDAELQVVSAIEVRDRWQLLCLGLGLLTLIGFFAGTAIGSKGNRYANVPA